MNNSTHGAQQQNYTLANGLHASADSGEALIPWFRSRPAGPRRFRLVTGHRSSATGDWRVRMQFDDEGGMVKGIEEGGQSLEDVTRDWGAPLPTLSPEKQALCVLKEPEWNVAKMAVSATDEDFVLETSSMGDATCEIVIQPPFNTYEDYFVGFTADSSAKITIVHDESSPIEGRTDRRGGEPLVYKIRFDPQTAAGEFVAHLCCIFPEEKMYSKFFEIKGVSS